MEEVEEGDEQKVMKTYIVESQSNYDLVVHIVNAYTDAEAIMLAKRAGAWDGCEVHEIDTKRHGVVHLA
jgi:hypothetical protein